MKKKERIFEYLNAITTAAIGTVGTVCGSIPLQVASLFVTIIYMIASDLGEHISGNKSANDELKLLIRRTCALAGDELSRIDPKKADFFRSVTEEIEAGIDTFTSVPLLIQTVQETLKAKIDGLAADMTEDDASEMLQLFVKCFIDALQDYPNLLNIMVADHEKRIADHENRIADLEIGRSSNNELTLLDDKKYYRDKYEETLFLHRRLPKEKQITLKDVYTPPAASIGKQYQWYKVIEKEEEQDAYTEKRYPNIKDAVREFAAYAPQAPGEKVVDILFIEGKAAMGKSSFISWICWHHAEKRDEIEGILGQRRLIVVKLRDITSSSEGALNIKSPFLQICAYLFKKSEQDLASIRQWKEKCRETIANSLLVLEGFDELCMLDGIVGEGKDIYFQNLHRELEQMDCGCKIIVTTRPEYLKVERLDFPKAHLDICPFTSKERKEWFEKYEKFYPVPSSIRKILINGDMPILEGIIDSPLTLYMIAARNVHLANNSNLWNIYHDIFAKEVYKRDYERGEPHAINAYGDMLYHLTAEIAYAVSCEQHLSITVDKLLNIKQVRDLLDQLVKEKGDIREVLEDCFGLASYFRISERNCEDGTTISAVEFYHNNIKDYFFCEYLWMHLEDIYAKIPSDRQEQEEWFLGSFQELFQYSICLKDSSEGVRARAIDFLESKVLYLKENHERVGFIQQELKQHYFEHFFGKMLQTGFLHHYTYTGKDNILHMMACIYSSVLSIYHTIYVPYLKDGERLPLAEEAYVIDIGTSFVYRILFIMSNLYDLSHIRFDGIMLSGIEFGRHNFQNSSFRECLLVGCNFDECDLRGADFSSAYLQNADFRNAIIDETTVFSETTEFERTKIKRNQLPYFSRWVGEDLFYADTERVTYIAPK